MTTKGNRTKQTARLPQLSSDGKFWKQQYEDKCKECDALFEEIRKLKEIVLNDAIYVVNVKDGKSVSPTNDPVTALEKSLDEEDDKNSKKRRRDKEKEAASFSF